MPLQRGGATPQVKPAPPLAAAGGASAGGASAALLGAGGADASAATPAGGDAVQAARRSGPGRRGCSGAGEEPRQPDRARCGSEVREGRRQYGYVSPGELQQGLKKLGIKLKAMASLPRAAAAAAEQWPEAAAGYEQALKLDRKNQDVRDGLDKAKKSACDRGGGVQPSAVPPAGAPRPRARGLGGGADGDDGGDRRGQEQEARAAGPRGEAGAEQGGEGWRSGEGRGASRRGLQPQRLR